MALPQGHVVLARDPFKRARSNRRPFIIVNNKTHPFHGEEYIAVAVTTQNHERAVPIPPEVWTSGTPRKQSHAMPWVLTTVKADVIHEVLGTIHVDVLDRIIEQALTYVLDTDKDAHTHPENAASLSTPSPNHAP